MGISLFFQLFAGVPLEEMDVLPLIPLGRWLFIVGIYLLIIGFHLGRNRQNRQFVIIRYGFVQRWWKHYFLKNLSGGVWTAVVLQVLFKLIDLLVQQKLTGSLKEILVISVLWTVHVIVLSSFFLFMETMKIRKMIPAVLLLMEGLTFLSGFHTREIARFMFGTWGMYVQSNLYENRYGFSIICVIAVQAAIIVGCYLLGGYMLEMKGMEGD